MTEQCLPKSQLIAIVQSRSQFLCLAKSECYKKPHTCHMGHCILSQAEWYKEPPKGQASREDLELLCNHTYHCDRLGTLSVPCANTV